MISCLSSFVFYLGVANGIFLCLKSLDHEVALFSKLTGFELNARFASKAANIFRVEQKRWRSEGS